MTCDVQRFDMVCTCDVEGAHEVEVRRLYAARTLGVRASDLTSTLIMSLAFDFGADAQIDMDMWFGVSVETTEDTLYIECDDPADGLLWLWGHLSEKYPGRAHRGSVSEEEHEADLFQSECLFNAWQSAMEAADRHHAEHESGFSSSCDVCMEGINTSGRLHAAIGLFWGVEVLNPAIKAA